MKVCEWERDEYNIFGKIIQSPRQISAFGEKDYTSKFKPTKSYTNHHRRPLHDEWPQELLKLKERVEEFTKETFPFALINRYNNGNDSIMWHSDNEKDIVENSSIVSISLGAERDFQFRPIPKTDDDKDTDSTTDKDSDKKSKKKHDVITKKLENGSMVVMNYQTQNFYQHALPKRKKVTTTRLNITFRNVTRE